MAAMTAEEIAAAQEEFAKRILGSGRYPFLAEDVEPDSPDTRQARFEFGLDCVLDGIAARLPGA